MAGEGQWQREDTVGSGCCWERLQSRMTPGLRLGQSGGTLAEMRSVQEEPV